MANTNLSKNINMNSVRTFLQTARPSAEAALIILRTLYGVYGRSEVRSHMEAGDRFHVRSTDDYEYEVILVPTGGWVLLEGSGSGKSYSWNILGEISTTLQGVVEIIKHKGEDMDVLKEYFETSWEEPLPEVDKDFLEDLGLSLT